MITHFASEHDDETTPLFLSDQEFDEEEDRNEVYQEKSTEDGDHSEMKESR